MNAVWFLLAGVVGGAMGGLGLGGGTLLIPILTFCLGLTPKLAAWVNLVVFIPTGIASLAFHVKNRLVDLKAAGFLLFFALVGAVVFFTLGKGLSDRFYRQAFGYFLLLIGSLSIISVLLGFSKQK